MEYFRMHIVILCCFHQKLYVYSYNSVLFCLALVAQRHCREQSVYSSAFRYKYFTEFKPMLGCGLGSNDSVAVFSYWGLNTNQVDKENWDGEVIMMGNPVKSACVDTTHNLW